MEIRTIKETEFVFNKFEIEHIMHMVNYYMNNSQYTSTSHEELQYNIRNAIADSKYRS